jgi:hypothetical protein
MAAPRAQVWSLRETFIGRPSDVGVDLHEGGFLTARPPQLTTSFTRHAVFLDALDDGEAPKAVASIRAR